MVYSGGFEGDVGGTCDELCPCPDPNAQCSGLPPGTLDFTCACNFPGFVDSDGTGNNCEPVHHETEDLTPCVEDAECAGGAMCVVEEEEQTDTNSTRAPVAGVCLFACTTDDGACPHEGFTCVDDPRDDCATLGGVCPGLCVALTTTRTTTGPTGRLGITENSITIVPLQLPWPFCRESALCGDEDGSAVCIPQPTEACGASGLENPDCVGVCRPACNATLPCTDDDVCIVTSDGSSGYCDIVPELCGGPTNEPCADGYTCTDNPISPPCDPSDPSCIGLCASSCGDPNAPVAACRNGTTCLSDPRQECEPSFMDDCHGVCLSVGPCDVPNGITCPRGTVCGSENTCVDDGWPLLCNREEDCPTDLFCDTAQGICAEPPSCGGLFDASCPNSYVCFDDPFAECKMSVNPECSGKCTKICESDDTCPFETACIQPPCVPSATSSCPSLCQPTGPCNVATGGIASCPGSLFCVEGECKDLVTDPMPCGGNLGSNRCPSGFKCTNDLTSDCRYTFNQNSCRGICVPQCSSDGDCGDSGEYVCNDDPFDDCDPVNNFQQRCIGICQTESSPAVPCGGPTQLSCPVAFTCFEGTCQRACAGFLGFLCPTDQVCQDDPRDVCDPRVQGGVCNGICVDGLTFFQEIPISGSTKMHHSIMALVLLVLSCVFVNIG